MLPLLFSLALTLGLWTAFYVVVYGTLRLFGRRFPVAFCVFGSLSLVGWSLLFGLLAFLVLTSFDDLAPSNPFWFLNFGTTFFVRAMGAILVSMLAAGGVLMRFVTQKQLVWWRGVLFTALYWAVAQAPIAYYFFHTYYSWFSQLNQQEIGQLSVVLLVNLFPMPPYNLSLPPYLVWFFPAFAPVGETLVHSFYRAYQQNKTGSFA